MKSSNQEMFRHNLVEGGSLLRTGVHDDRKKMDANKKSRSRCRGRFFSHSRKRLKTALRMKMGIAVPVSAGWGLYSPQLMNWEDGTRKF
jgi:hypothetical protein